jgi:hypothetical protein
MRDLVIRFRNVLAITLFAFLPCAVSVSAQKGGASPAQPAGGSQGSQGSTPYFETEMLAYGAANQLSQAIAQKVCNTSPSIVPPNATIIIFDQQSFQNLAAWQSFVIGTQALKDAYNTIDPAGNFNAMAGGFFLGGADLGAFITAIGASTTNNASAFTVQDTTMAVSLMHQMQRINCTVKLVYYPLFGSYADLNSATVNVKNALLVLNTVRQDILNNIICDPTVNPITCLDTTDPRAAAFTDLNTQYDILLKDFLSLPGQSSGGAGAGQAPPATGGQNPSSGASPNSAAPSAPSSGAMSLVQGAELEQLIEKSDSYVLYADVVAAGGTQRDVKNLFTLFTGDWLSYSGGLVVNLALVKSKDTQLVFSDTLRYRTGFHHRDLWDVLGFVPLRTPHESPLVESVNAGSNESSLCEGNRTTSTFSYSYHPTGGCATGHADVVRRPISMAQNEVVGGKSVTGIVELSERAKSDTPISVVTSDPTVSINGAPRVKRGSQSGTFVVDTHPTPTQIEAVISFTDDHGELQSAVLTIDPSPLSIAPSEAGPGVLRNGTLLLNESGADPTLVLLRSSDARIIFSTPVAAPTASQTKITFTIQTPGVPAPTDIVISAIYNNVVQSTKIKVR